MYLLCIIKNISTIIYIPNQTFKKKQFLKESPACSLLDYISLHHGMIKLARTGTTTTRSAAIIIGYAGPQVQKRSRKHLTQ